MELHLHPTVWVAMDLFTLGTGDPCGLAAEYAGLGMFQRGAVGNLRGRGEKAVAIALVKVILGVGGVAAQRLFEDLRLLAFMNDFSQQPQRIALAARVAAQRQQVAAGERGLVAMPPRLTIIGAMALECAPAEQRATVAVGETTGVIIVFKVRLFVLGVVAPAGLQRQAWFLEVVVGTRGATGARRQTHVEPLDHRFIRGQATVLHIGRWPAQFREHGLDIAKHQGVALSAVSEVKVNPLLLAQALNEVQIGLVVLHAILAIRAGGAQIELVGVALYSMLFEDQCDDPRHRQLLVDPLVDAMAQVGQVRH